MAYSFVRPIYVGPQQIGGVSNAGSPTLSDFTVVIFGTFSYLATIANGGDVTSSSGYDIVVATDSAGVTLSSFQMLSYDATTGTVRLAIKLSSMVGTAGTLLYLLYGNSAITTDQGVGLASIWDSNTTGMWALEGLTDSGPSGRTLTATGSPTSGATGFIGSAYTFTNASTQYLSAASAAVSGYPCTIAARAKLSTTSLSTGTDRVIAAVCQTGGLNEFWISYYNNGGTTGVRAIAQSGANARSAFYPLTLDLNWHHIVGVFTNSSQLAVFFDGVLLASGISIVGGTGLPSPTSLDATYIGNFVYNTSSIYQGFLGTIDEVKIASAARPSNWIATENCDQGGYVTVGPLLTTGGSGSANYGFIG